LHEGPDRLVVIRASGTEAAAAERLRRELIALQQILRLRHLPHLVHGAHVLLVLGRGLAAHAVRLTLREILEFGRRHLPDAVQPAGEPAAPARATGPSGTTRAAARRSAESPRTAPAARATSPTRSPAGHPLRHQGG